MFNQIKWAYQRVVKGYDDRIYWGFDSVVYTIREPLKKFCEDWFLDREVARLNPGKTKVISRTLYLIEKWENETNEESIYGTNMKKLAKHFGGNIGYYWD